MNIITCIIYGLGLSFAYYIGFVRGRASLAKEVQPDIDECVITPPPKGGGF